MRKLTLFSALSLAACGSGPASPLDGYWQISSGTVTTTCTGEAAQTNQINEVVQFSDGVTSGTVVAVTSAFADGCATTYTLNGSIASAANQVCNVPATANAAGETITVTSDTITLNGTSFTEAGSGTFVSGTTTCSFTLSDTATKVAQLN